MRHCIRPLYMQRTMPPACLRPGGQAAFLSLRKGKRLAGNRIAIHRDILPSVPSQISSALVAGTHSLEKSLPQIPAHQARRYEFPVQRGEIKSREPKSPAGAGGMFCCCCPLAGQCIPRWRAALRVHLPRLAGSPSPGPLFNFFHRLFTNLLFVKVAQFYGMNLCNDFSTSFRLSMQKSRPI